MVRKRSQKEIRNQRRSGAVTLEFALVVPLIFLLFLGAIELTNVNMIRHTAANAAYEGARQAIVPGGTDDDARQAVLHLLNMVGITTDVGIDVEQWPDRVRVTISVPLHLNSWGIGRFTSDVMFTQSCTLHREVIEHSL